MDCITPEKLIDELREYSQTLELVAAVKSAPCAASEAREELPLVLAFLAQLESEVAEKPVKVRCTWYREIRRCYAIAREVGLDVKSDSAMRAAFGRFLGRRIESRETLDGSDWLLIGNAIKSQHLAW